MPQVPSKNDAGSSFMLLQTTTRGQSRCFDITSSHVVHLYTSGRDRTPEYSWFLKLRGWPRPHRHKLKLFLSSLSPLFISPFLSVSFSPHTVSDLSSKCYETVNKIVFSKFNKNDFESRVEVTRVYYPEAFDSRLESRTDLIVGYLARSREGGG